MKISILGTGFVGATAAFALTTRGAGREVVLIDKNADRAAAEANDILHGIPFSHPMTVRAGTTEDIAGSKVVIIAAGVGQKPGESRLDLLSRNAAVFESIVPPVLEQAPDAILVIATNPVDIMTHVAAKIAGRHGVPSHRVIGSGTMLDTARFRSLLANQLGIDSRHVHAYVLGEHGDSEVLAWSAVRVGGIALDDFTAARGIECGADLRASIDDRVRNAAYHIIEGKGATYYGVSSALAYLTEVILFDRRALLTVCTPEERLAGVENVTVSMPHVVGGDGVIGDHHPIRLADDEQVALERSASKIKALSDDLDARTEDAPTA